jgi:hypothetical protein
MSSNVAVHVSKKKKNKCMRASTAVLQPYGTDTQQLESEWHYIGLVVAAHFAASSFNATQHLAYLLAHV